MKSKNNNLNYPLYYNNSNVSINTKQCKYIDIYNNISFTPLHYNCISDFRSIKLLVIVERQLNFDNQEIIEAIKGKFKTNEYYVITIAMSENKNSYIFKKQFMFRYYDLLSIYAIRKTLVETILKTIEVKKCKAFDCSVLVTFKLVDNSKTKFLMKTNFITK